MTSSMFSSQHLVSCSITMRPLCPPTPFPHQSRLALPLQGQACRFVNLISQIPLTPSNFSSLNSTQLLSPTRSRLHFFNGTQLIGSVARYADVVIALENELEVAKFEG